MRAAWLSAELNADMLCPVGATTVQHIVMSPALAEAIPTGTSGTPNTVRKHTVLDASFLRHVTTYSDHCAATPNFFQLFPTSTYQPYPAQGKAETALRLA